MGWVEVALGGVEIIDCPGDHTGMLADPNVELVAIKLRASLERALHPEKPERYGSVD